MARIRLKYVTYDPDPRGNPRYYFRKRSQPQKIRIPGRPGSDEFMSAYQACLEGLPIPSRKTAPERPITDSNSLRWLCQQYFASRAYKALNASTQSRRRSVLSAICEQPISDTNAKPIGDAPFSTMTTKAVRRIRDRRADQPGAASDWLKGMKALFKWAVEEEFTEHNPAKDVPKLRMVTDGHHTWTPAELIQFERTHPIGTTARLAYALLRYTGCRLADAPRFGRQHIENGYLTYTQKKNEKNNPVTLCLPILPELAEAIDAMPRENLTFLVNAYGKPFTEKGFGNKMRDWCDAAGLPDCSAHGLRKAGAANAAENGATASELMAMFGWRDINQAQLYTRKAEQKKLATNSMHKITGRDKSGSNVSHFPQPPGGSETKSPKTAAKLGT